MHALLEDREFQHAKKRKLYFTYYTYRNEFMINPLFVYLRIAICIYCALFIYSNVENSMEKILTKFQMRLYIITFFIDKN